MEAVEMGRRAVGWVRFPDISGDGVDKEIIYG